MSNDSKLTPEVARRLIERDEEQRLAACMEEIEQVLGRHSCQFVAMPIISADGRIVATVQLQLTRNVGGNSA